MFVVALLVMLIDAERSPLGENLSTMLEQHGLIFYHAMQHGMFL